MSAMNIVEIDAELCNRCQYCVEVFGCPAIQRGPLELGKPGVPWIHPDLCNGNGSCIQVCPTKAIKRPNPGSFGKRPSGGSLGSDAEKEEGAV